MGASIGTFPTGRLRRSEHDGFTSDGAVGPGFEIEEQSIYANVAYTLPGTLVGGRMKLGVMLGFDELSLETSNSGFFRRSTIDNQSMLFGGTALWYTSSVYALASVVGYVGQSDIRNSNSGRTFEQDTNGVFGSAVFGRVVDLGGAKVDLRSGLNYSWNEGEQIVFNAAGHSEGSRLETFSGSTSVMLFNDFKVGTGTLRPFVMGTLKHNISYRNQIVFEGTPGTYSLDEARGHRIGEVGLNYFTGSWNVFGAAYADYSADERTVGGKLGASYSFNTSE